jgi:hypothetical protein
MYMCRCTFNTLPQLQHGLETEVRKHVPIELYCEIVSHPSTVQTFIVGFPYTDLKASNLGCAESLLVEMYRMMYPYKLAHM